MREQGRLEGYVTIQHALEQAGKQESSGVTRLSAQLVAKVEVNPVVQPGGDAVRLKGSPATNGPQWSERGWRGPAWKPRIQNHGLLHNQGPLNRPAPSRHVCLAMNSSALPAQAGGARSGMPGWVDLRMAGSE